MTSLFSLIILKLYIVFRKLGLMKTASNHEETCLKGFDHVRLKAALTATETTVQNWTK